MVLLFWSDDNEKDIWSELDWNQALCMDSDDKDHEKVADDNYKRMD